jgi:DNA-binding transcriptional regulator YdaS (Cro superfamily)
MLAKIARELGLQRQATSKWTKVPAAHVLAVARISRISRSTLRPDLYPKRGRD